MKSIFLENEWDIPDSFLTTELLVEKVAASLENKHLRRDQTSLERRKLGTLYVIDVAKTCKLGVDVRGSIALLSKYTFCSYRFAKSVLIAIKNGTEDQLFQRCDAIHADTL